MTTDGAARPLELAVTSGEPAGVGPELTIQALAQLDAQNELADVRYHVLGDAELLAQRADTLGLQGEWAGLQAGGRVVTTHHALAVPAQAGHLDARNGPYVLALLDDAIDGTLHGRYDALITAPLQKSTINDAGVPFTGHTEYLAQRTGVAKVVMMLAGGGLRVALATTHLPLARVPAALERGDLLATLRIIDADLARYFGKRRPRILVTGLNPHAGEHGYLGREEIDVIEPALADARAEGIDAMGPYPADTLFQPRYLADADCVLAMYHDQGLPVLKYASFGRGVNITLGLPIIRTSVDHGTALDLAGSGRADCGSLIEALRTAAHMARTVRRIEPAA